MGLRIGRFPVLLAAAVGGSYFPTMSSTYEIFAECLRVLRARRRLTQAEVAAGSAIAPATISDYENVKNAGPGVGELLSLANFFDVSVDHLLGRTECEGMPAPKRWVIDLNEERSPTSADAEWATEIPAKFSIVTEEEKKRRAAAVLDRWRTRKGRKDANQQG